jgi:hypothetical protein
MRKLLRGRGSSATERDESSTWKRRRVQLLLAGAGAAAAGIVLGVFGTSPGYATSAVSITSDSTKTCFVTVTAGHCSYSAAKTALTDVDSAGGDVYMNVDGWGTDGLQMTVDTGSFQTDDLDKSLVIDGIVHLPQTDSDVPAQISAYWGSTATTTTPPQVAFAVKLGDQDMSALNGLWSTPGLDLSLGGVVLATSPTATADKPYVLDGTQLPGNFLDGVDPMTLQPGLNMHADVVAGSDQPAAVANVLQYIGLSGTDSTSLDGTLGSTAGLLFDLSDVGGSGIDLTLTASSTGDPLPSWITSRTSSLEIAIGDDGPRITVNDELDTLINGKDNAFTGQATFDATSADAPSLSMSYGVNGTFDAPFGLDGLTITSANLGLSLTIGDTPSFSGSMDVGVTINSKPFTLHVDISVASGLVSGNFGVNGEISVADATDIGNALLGTEVTAPSGAEDVALTGVTFSFSTSTTPAELKFALEASTELHGAAADALISISKEGDDPVKFFAGMHVADLSIDDLVESPSEALQGLSFPNVDLFVSKGYVGDDGQPVEVNWDDLLPAEQTFFTTIYGDTPPDTVTFGANVVFDGTVTLPDSISSYFSTSDPLHLHGELGFGFDALGTGSPAKLAGSLTAELPGINSDWLQGSSWSLTIAADSNGAAQVSLAGDLDADIDGTSYPVSIEGKFTHTSEGTSIDLSGSVTGTFTSLFGLDWLDVTDPSVSLGIEHTSEGTHLSAALDADVTISGYTVHVSAAISNADGTEASLDIKSAEDSVASVDLSDLASFFGAGDVPSGQGSLSLTSIHGRATYSKTAGGTLDIVADTSLDMGGASSLDSELLLSIHKVNGQTKVIFGFRTVNPVDLSDIVTTLPAGVDLHFDTLAVVVANPAMTIKATDMLSEEMDFFQPFCADADSACHDQISLKSGVNFVSATRVPESLSNLIGAVHVDPDAPVLVTGTIPVFGGGAFNLSVDLPAIDGAGDTPDFYQSGRLSLNVSNEGFSMAGHLTFNIPKKQATSEADCTDLSGVWRAERGTGTMGCYDQVPFALTADIQLGDGPPSMTLTGGLDNNYIWHSPNGASWLDLNAATIQFGITAATPVEFTLGFRLAASIKLGPNPDDIHDFDGSMLLGIAPLEAPPFIAIDPKGFRIASGSGLSMADMVKLANLVSGSNLSLGGIPNIAVRNIEFAFAEQDDPALCLVQGIHIAGDLYINPTADAHTITSADPCPTSADQEIDRTKLCQDDSANGCFAAADFAINDNGLHASGSIGGFDAGPLHFGGALVDLKVTPSVQHLVVHGAAEIQDIASGQVDLLISRTLLHFRASASLFGTSTQAFLDGSATIPSFTTLSDLEKGGSFSITAVLKSDFLNKAAVAISGTLQQLKPALQAISAILEDLDQGHILTALTEIPTKVAQLGVSLPNPYGSAIKEISDKLSYIHDQIALFDHDVSWGIDQLLNGFTLSFPGIPGVVTPETCITTWSGGRCWTTPPFDTIFGTVPGIPGTVVPATCITTWGDDGNCYSIPPITGIHIPGLCEDLHGVISAIPSTCDGTSISNNLLLPVLRTIIKQTSGYDIGDVDLHTVLSDINNAFGSGQTVSIDCAEFQATADINATPSASVHLSADFDIFGDKLTAGVGWNFSSDSTNPATVISNLLNAIIHPNLNLHDTCALPADWNTNADFPDMVGTAPATGDDTPPPTPTLALQFAHSTINEGSTASLSGTVTPTPAGSPTVTISWGTDQGTSTATVSNGTFTATHTFDNNTPVGQPSAQYNVTANVASGPSSSAMLTVANVAPSSLTLTPASTSLNEGSSTTLHATFNDPGDDTHDVSVSWGDGSTSSLSLAAGVNQFTTSAHTYADNNGTNAGFPVSVTVTDDDLATATATTTINVANVAPNSISVVQLCPPTAPATTPVACTTAATPEQQVQNFRFSFTDPGTVDTTTAVIDWGDGTAQQTVNLGVLRSFTVPHIWTEADTDAHQDGHFPISVTLTDKDNGTGTGSLTEVVTNVAPSSLTECLLGTVNPSSASCPGAATINEGDTVSLFGGFQDVSALDDHTVTIDWGLGWPTTTRYDSLPLATGVFTYSDSRAFGDEGTYTITVTVADDDGASVTTTVRLTVLNVAPTAVIDHTGTFSVQGVDAFLGHATHTMNFSGSSDDPGSDDLTLSWLWRDGTSTSHGFPDDPAVDDETTPEDPTVDSKSFTDPESHAWAASCFYQPQFSSTDGDVTTPTQDSVDLVITNNDPTRYASGTWISATKSKNPPATLPCYLKIVQRMSAVFHGPSSAPGTAGPIPLTTNAEALNIVQSSSNDARVKLEREVLTMWFDFANGGFDYTTLIDTDKDGIPDSTFAEAMHTAESLILNQASTQSQMLNYRNNLAPLTGE